MWYCAKRRPLLYNMMMTHEQTTAKISDYVLGLLPAAQRRAVEQHTAVCADCRRKLQQERQFSQFIGQTVAAATAPPPGRLAALQPPAPVGSRRWPHTLRQQVALAATLLVVLFAGLGLRQFAPPGSDGTLPAFMAVTSTASATPTQTDAPTSTLASLAGPGAPVLSTAVPIEPAADTPAPSLAPTPIAAVIQNAN